MREKRCQGRKHVRNKRPLTSDLWSNLEKMDTTNNIHASKTSSLDNCNLSLPQRHTVLDKNKLGKIHVKNIAIILTLVPLYYNDAP